MPVHGHGAQLVTKELEDLVDTIERQARFIPLKLAHKAETHPGPEGQLTLGKLRRTALRLDKAPSGRGLVSGVLFMVIPFGYEYRK